MLTEPRHEKTCLSHMITTKAQISLRSLISAFVVHSMDSMISIDAVPKTSRLLLASEAEQAGLSLTWSKPRTQYFSWQGSTNGVNGHEAFEVDGMLLFFTAHQNYFTPYEPNQSLGGTKIPQKNRLTTCK